MKKNIPFIISLIKADLECVVYQFKNDKLGYDFGDFVSDLGDLSKYCKRKMKRRKVIAVRQGVFAKR